MNENARLSYPQGRRRWLIASLTLLAMTVLHPVLAQDDDDEPLVLASENKMQTDSINSDTFDFWSKCGCYDGQVQLPVLGRAKVGENNSAMPRDRFYFVYKHFHNSLHSTVTDNAGSTVADRDFSLDRYNVGAEKTFGDGNWSVELRMPMIGTLDFFNAGFSNQFGGIGNLSVIGKRLIYESETTAWATGLGLSVPTGADSQIQVFNQVFTIKNEAVHLFPFVGFLSAPSERLFFQGFTQLDVPTNGNSLEFQDINSGAAATSLGSVRDQVLLYVDLSAGYWLYRNPSAPIISGMAPALTLHYTTALEDAHTLAGTSTDTCTDFAFGNAANRFDVLNLNVGVYTTWFNRITTYTGIVSPLDDGTNRFFDMEAQFSLNYYY